MATGRTRTRAPGKPAGGEVKYAGTALSANAWHTAADWVESVIAGCPRPAGNTDDGYNRLNEWAVGPYAEALARSHPGQNVDRSLARRARPEGRIRPNRFKR